MKEFKGRIITPGKVQAEALVSHNGLNTLASFQKALQFGDNTATCGDQNNPDLLMSAIFYHRLSFRFWSTPKTNRKYSKILILVRLEDH